MKAMQVLRIARRCGVLASMLWLAFPRPAAAQTFFSAINRTNPEVRIISPANHAAFFAPVDIAIFAYAHRSLADALDITFTNVEFFAATSSGTNDLGGGFDLDSTHPSLKDTYGNFVIARPVIRLGSVYCLVWTNAPAGSYALTAVAQGHEPGLASVSRTSAPVNITILASPITSAPTNIVSIVATDPIAIAGTNACWVWPGMTNAIPAWTNWPPPRWQNFTNWGPKNALFTVRRFGDVSTDLTVNYNIGGTATNGVDYATLTNFVIIPAGEACALIPVVPIDNGTTNFTKTVVLTLTQDTNTPPGYIVGIPPRAVAVILDNWPWPRPVPLLLPDGSFHFNASGTNGGPDGAWFSVQNSSDLQNWSPVATNQVFQGSIDFVDPDAPDYSTRFYRILQLPNAPSN